MQVYFGAVPVGKVVDADTMFVSERDDEHYFYYGIEYGSGPGGTEEVTVYDSVGREVPVDMESIPAMIEALTLVYDLHKINAMYEKVNATVYNANKTATISPI